jgi:prepilin-type N-terminal cleavage/methylation domain-containing protein/prepilin-type processing-associated H-X9-DG protein
MTHRRRAFTLIELLVVVAIISLLVSILLPSLQHAKELAKGTVCMTNLKGIGTAAQMYFSENNSMVPPVFQLNPAWGWWENNAVVHYTGHGFLESTAYGQCPSFKTEEAVFTANRLPPALDGWPALPSGLSNRNYGSIGGVMSAFSSKRNYWHVGGSYRPYPEVINNKNYPRRPSHEVYMMDSHGESGLGGQTLAERKGSVTAFGDRTDQPGSMILGGGKTPEGESAWTNISTRHGYRTNCVFLDGHVESVEAERLWHGEEGDYDCMWDGLTGN